RPREESRSSSWLRTSRHVLAGPKLRRLRLAVGLRLALGRLALGRLALGGRDLLRAGALARLDRARVAALGPHRRMATLTALAPGAAALGLGPQRGLDVVDDLVLPEQLVLELAPALMQLALLEALLDLVAKRVEGQLARGPAPGDLDDVIAELGLHRLGDLAGIHLERGLGELLGHPIGREDADVPALLRARPGGVLARDRLEVGALGRDELIHLVGLLLGL